MIEQIVGNKKYVLEKISYDIVGGKEGLYIQIKIFEDIQFGVREYFYGLNFNSEEIKFFIDGIIPLKDYIVSRLIELNA